MDHPEAMRFTLDTVGKTDWPRTPQGSPIYPEGFEELAAKRPGHPLQPPGRDVRCIVSVGMLTGFDELADVKKAAAERWVAAVNAEGGFGRWRFVMARSVAEVRVAMDLLSAPA